MGIRSDVFFAHKNTIQLPQEYADMLMNRFGAKVLFHPEGTGYSMDYVKWYRNDDEELIQFYNFLETKVDYCDYTVIEACLDYPESSDGDAGEWYNNPWGASRYVRTGIEFDKSVGA